MKNNWTWIKINSFNSTTLYFLYNFTCRHLHLHHYHYYITCHYLHIHLHLHHFHFLGKCWFFWLLHCVNFLLWIFLKVFLLIMAVLFDSGKWYWERKWMELLSSLNYLYYLLRDIVYLYFKDIYSFYLTAACLY